MGEELEPVLEMTDYELEEALRPVVLRGGHEYTTEASLAGFVKQLRVTEAARQTKSYTPLVRAETERVNGKSMQVFSGIVGPDNRIVRRDNTVYPWSTVTYLPLDSGGYSGSGVMIGESTALTAPTSCTTEQTGSNSRRSLRDPTSRIRLHFRSAYTGVIT